jgi:hypothetical protein
MRAPHAAHHVALDVEAEDGLGRLFRLVGVLGDLDAAGLSTPTDLDLRLDDDDSAELLGSRAHLLGGVGDDARKDRDPVLLKQVSGLILV